MRTLHSHSAHALWHILKSLLLTLDSTEHIAPRLLIKRKVSAQADLVSLSPTKILPLNFRHQVMHFRYLNTSPSTKSSKLKEAAPYVAEGYEPNGNRTTRARPASSRYRSRSPALAAQPPSYRDRGPARRQSGSTLERSVEGKSAGALDGVDDLKIGDADIEDKQLRMAELQKEKNKHTVCVHCWLNELSCDHQWPCKECKVRRKLCAYIACPMENCALDVKCPAYHQFKKLPKENRKVECPMHMIALLNLNCPFINTYNVQKIQKKIETPASAQQIYLLLQQEIEGLVQQTNNFDDTTARKLLQESEKVPRMGDKSLKIKARLIVKLVKEMK